MRAPCQADDRTMYELTFQYSTDGRIKSALISISVPDESELEHSNAGKSIVLCIKLKMSSTNAAKRFNQILIH